MDVIHGGLHDIYSTVKYSKCTVFLKNELDKEEKTKLDPFTTRKSSLINLFLRKPEMYTYRTKTLHKLF